MNNTFRKYRDNKGITLLVIMLMLSSLVCLVTICAYIMAQEADDDTRYQITLERIQQIKRALFGRLAEQPDGEDITSCGGFISDYGPEFVGWGAVDYLITKKDEWEDWHYDSDTQFWAGWRGPYLTFLPGEENLSDGWGNEFKNGDVGLGCTAKIKWYGSDGINNLPEESDYKRDFEFEYDYGYRVRRVTVSITNTSAADADLKVEIIYPQMGNVVKVERGPVNIPADGEPHNVVFNNPSGLTLGLRKMVIRDAITNEIKMIKMLCIPPSPNPPWIFYSVDITYEG